MNSNSNINSFDFNNIVKQEKIENKFDDRFKMFLSTDVARFHWDIIMVCNQKCSYCYARQFDEWGNLNNLKMINSVLNKLKQIKKPIEVVLLGGEPTLSPYYKYICEEIYKLPNLIYSVVYQITSLINLTIYWYFTLNLRINLIGT